jgi:hypothetical protein
MAIGYISELWGCVLRSTEVKQFCKNILGNMAMKIFDHGHSRVFFIKAIFNYSWV